ncbi:MAG: hypothetical protein OEZ15_07695 [Gammaproteobacteria bacterium]|nr:hypothetical protein [Gammaproteobacteria bacterium]
MSLLHASHRTTLLYCSICLCLATSPASIAMSRSQETPSNQTVSQPADIDLTKASKFIRQYQNRDPEADARAAIEEGDLRLLGFALRATNVPGVATEDRQVAIETCGVHFLEGFGDILHKGDDISIRRQVFEYVKHYNAVMVAACLKKP